MEAAGLVVAIATLVLVASAALGRTAFRPRIRVYLPDGSTAIQYPAVTQQTLSLHVKNGGGWLGLPSGVVDAIWVAGYFPDEFDLQSAEYMGSGETTFEPASAPQDGRFRGTKFLSVGRFSLFKDEADVVRFTFTTPTQTGRYKVYAAILSERGHGGVYELKLTIS